MYGERERMVSDDGNGGDDSTTEKASLRDTAAVHFYTSASWNKDTGLV